MFPIGAEHHCGDAAVFAAERADPPPGCWVPESDLVRSGDLAPARGEEPAIGAEGDAPGNSLVCGKAGQLPTLGHTPALDRAGAVAHAPISHRRGEPVAVGAEGQAPDRARLGVDCEAE